MGANLAERVAGNAVEQSNQPTIGQVIARMQPELARALPKHLDADRMARLALTLVRRDQLEASKTGRRDTLARCSPESFAGALLTAAALGLEPGVDGEAYLVAYKSECTLIVGYKGMVKLFWQHPLAQHVDAQAVYEADEFDFRKGLDPFLNHKPALLEDRGKIVAYYAVAKLTTGASSFLVLSPEEVKTLRSGNVGPSGRIPDPQRWMEKKTVLRQLFKLLPKSTQLVQALEVDERSGRELQAELVDARRQIEAAAATVGPPPPAPGPPAGVDRVTGEAGAGYRAVDDPASDADAEADEAWRADGGAA
ncbi:MAG TPA: recombinase RecT [Dermatophilaceae bacterium]